MLRGAVLYRKIAGAVDERDVGQRLRKISDLPLAHRIKLLGQQANVVTQLQQSAK